MCVRVCVCVCVCPVPYKVVASTLRIPSRSQIMKGANGGDKLACNDQIQKECTNYDSEIQKGQSMG